MVKVSQRSHEKHAGLLHMYSMFLLHDGSLSAVRSVVGYERLWRHRIF